MMMCFPEIIPDIGKPISEASEIANGRNCPTCANREKVRGLDTERGDWWRCTATPLIPAFTGQFYGGTLQHINLAAFEEGHPCAEVQRARSCPLWSGRDILKAPGRGAQHNPNGE